MLQTALHITSNCKHVRPTKQVLATSHLKHHQQQLAFDSASPHRTGGGRCRGRGCRWCESAPEGSKEVEGLAPKGVYQAAHVILGQPIVLQSIIRGQGQGLRPLWKQRLGCRPLLRGCAVLPVSS